MFGPGEFAVANGGHASPGAQLHVLFARESRTQQPGFYIVNGEIPLRSARQPHDPHLLAHREEGGVA